MAIRSAILVVALTLLASLSAAYGARCSPGEETCLDCSTRQVCTIFGPIPVHCWVPGLRHCVNGSCVREPSEECRPTPPNPPPTTPPNPPPTTPPNPPPNPPPTTPPTTAPTEAPTTTTTTTGSPTTSAVDVSTIEPTTPIE